MIVTLVVVLFNSENELECLVKCFSGLDPIQYRMILVDNASTDNSLHIASNAAVVNSAIKVCSMPANGGFAAGVNFGVRMAIQDGADWVILLNPDTFFESEDWALSDHLCSKHRVVTPVIRSWHDPEEFWYTSGGYSLLRGFAGKHFVSFASPPASPTYLTSFAPACCLAIRADVFNDVGFFDESYFMYFEDADFCRRLMRRKIPIMVDSRWLIHHKVGASSGGVFSSFTVFHTSRNRIRYLRKHFGLMIALSFVPIFVGFYFYRFLIVRGEPRKFCLALMQTFYGFFAPYEK